MFKKHVFLLNNLLRVLFIGRMMLFCACYSANAQTFTLKEAIDCALSNNISIVRQAIQVSKQQVNQVRVQSDYALHITPTAAADTSDNTGNQQLGIQAEKQTTWGTLLTASANLANENNSSIDTPHSTRISVGITQPLFRRFGTLMNEEPIQQANSRFKSVMRNYELGRESLVLNVVRSYETLFRTRQKHEEDLASLIRLKQLKRLTRVRVKQGFSTRVDLLRVELQLGEAASRISQGKERLKAMQREFNELLGIPIENQCELSELAVLTLKLENPEEHIKTALNERLDYAQVLDDFNDAQRHTRIARRALLPDISLISRYSQYSSGASWSDATALDEDDWLIGITAETDWNRTAVKSDIKQAELDENAGRLAIQLKQIEIAREVFDARSSYTSSLTELTLAEENYELAAKRLAIARRFYRSGKGDNFAVTDAESALQDAENRLLTWKGQSVITGYEFLKTCGLLLEHNAELKPGGLRSKSTITLNKE